ncbi:ribbon-helix-helix domain-containing protein [Saccharothrix sp. AJ9571]|nr:ribbon-helix-helix domain-containing protein [Saccharothrix sp. AJ9571]
MVPDKGVANRVGTRVVSREPQPQGVTALGKDLRTRVSSDTYEATEKIARKRGVSMAHIVRQAVENYLEKAR